MDEQLHTEQAEILRTAVRERYGQLAEAEEAGGCCGPGAESCCGADGQSTFGIELYEAAAVADLPATVTGLSLGCGNPVALAALQPGQTVLDLGAGGGIDCFLAARQVGPEGRVIGVDMTPAMVSRARANRAKIIAEQPTAANVEFRLGEIEHLPVADDSVDVIISNCVINLSTDKAQVLREAFRVLRPGGRLAISDVVTDGPLPATVKNDLAAWAGCVSGALDASDYRALLAAAGFVEVTITADQWAPETVEAAVAQLDPEVATELEGSDPSLAGVAAAVFNARITAVKPDA